MCMIIERITFLYANSNFINIILLANQSLKTTMHLPYFEGLQQGGLYGLSRINSGGGPDNFCAIELPTGFLSI